jgi:L-threonine-O-3-phosphate decarboxylase
LIRPLHGGNLAWAASLVDCPQEQILDFSASINPLGPPASVIAAIQVAVSALRDYPDPSYTDLCQFLAMRHQLDQDWILPGNGSAELLTWASRDLAVLDHIVLPMPAFSDYGRAIGSFQGHIFPCPLAIAEAVPGRSSSTLDVKGLERSAQGLDQSLSQALTLILSRLKGRSPEARLGLLLNNPHNPTGQLWSSDELLPWLERFEWIVVDEAFMDFLPPQEEQSLIPWVVRYPNLVVLRSLTKFYSLPGLRLGYAIAHPQTLRRWQQWRDPWPVNTLAVAAAIAALQDTEFQQQTWDWLPCARQQLSAGLAALPGLLPLESAANFLLVACQSSGRSLQHQLLQTEQILIRDCLSFPELGDRYFRVAVRTIEDNQRLLSGLAKCLLAPPNDGT